MGLSTPPPTWSTVKNKPTTVAGFGITDMATQTVAAAANATNVTNVTTSQVTAAMAGASAGGVGTYAFAGSNTWGPTTASYGATVAGSSLSQAGISIDDGGTSNSGWQTGKGGGGGMVAAKGTGALSGTWRCMGAASNLFSGSHPATVWLRIS